VDRYGRALPARKRTSKAAHDPEVNAPVARPDMASVEGPRRNQSKDDVTRGELTGTGDRDLVTTLAGPRNSLASRPRWRDVGHVQLTPGRGDHP